MSARSRLLILGGVVVLLSALAGLAYHNSQRVHALVAVQGVPADTQQNAAQALAARGLTAMGNAVWAGPRTSWQAPGRYRLFFAGAAQEGTDIYRADVQVDGQGHVALLSLARVTDTPAGDEDAPVLAGQWLAFATRVTDRYQSITCVSLADLKHPDVYAFAQPVKAVNLLWQSQPDGTFILRVISGEGALARESTIEPVAKDIGPAEADLQYLPVQRGQQAWLPNLVSRVRELPGIGPEKIAFLENVFFTITDYLTRLTHGPVAPTVLPPTPAVASSPTVAASLEPVHETQATAIPTIAPSSTPSLTPTPQGKLLADGVVWRDTVQPDPQRPYANVEIVEIDPSLLQIKMIPGTIEPRPSTGLVGSGVIPKEDWPYLVAGFNGGFAAMHGQYGMMVDRKVYLPARDGIATLAVYEDGSIRIGTWGKDLVQTPDMVSYRQNCPPLIENGTITAETGKLTLWGLSVANEVYLYRSGLGLTRDGRLVYVAGKPLSAYTLARALQMAGAVYAMQLDVDEFHVAFFTYDVQVDHNGGDPTIEGHKLRSDMRGFDGYFLQPFQLDFFYLVRRPEPLANAVRVAPASQTPAVYPTLVSQPDLPGRLAFASIRDGNWELYSLLPGQPHTLQRLTEHPADDLYPAWSPDGRQLAFASRRDGNAEIYVLDTASGALRRVTEQGSEEWAPTWSPDSQWLAYQSDRNGQSDIYVCALDGTDETRLTPMEGNHEAPHWSPDGKLFVFDSDLDVAEAVHASINLYLMGADGSNPHRLVSNAESPCWSPDGQTIAFTSRRTGRWQVYLVGADGSGLRQLTRGAYDARYPSWSPDGRWLAFAGNDGGHWEIYAIPVTGGEAVRLTVSDADSTYPSWGP